MSQVHIFVSYSHDDARAFWEDKLMRRLSFTAKRYLAIVLRRFRSL